MTVRQLQDNLRAKGFDPGPTDGLLGRRTYAAFAKCLSGGRAPNGTGDLLALNLPIGEINTRLWLIHFFAQVTHESGFRNVGESLNYSAAGLLATFSRARICAARCRGLGRRDGDPAEQEEIANTVYGGACGANHLGNTEAGDGWRYRGRGLIQLTGRANYRRTGAEYELNPELLETPAGSMKAAVDFWRTRGLNPAADVDDLVRVTRLINGGTVGLEGRRALTERAKTLWPG